MLLLSKTYAAIWRNRTRPPSGASLIGAGNPLIISANNWHSKMEQFRQ